MFPNSSAPLSIAPLLLRSSTRNALVEFCAVQEIFSGTPSLRMLKTTPPAALVIENPLWSTSITIGEVLMPSGQLQVKGSYPVGSAQRLWNCALRWQAPPLNTNPVAQPVDG